MQDVALTVAAIVAHTSAVHGDREVLTARGPGRSLGCPIARWVSVRHG